MTPRQAYALANPLGRADGPAEGLLPYRADRRHATGMRIRTILAVDR